MKKTCLSGWAEVAAGGVRHIRGHAEQNIQKFLIQIICIASIQILN
jgi:hypothetical protein